LDDFLISPHSSITHSPIVKATTCWIHTKFIFLSLFAGLGIIESFLIIF
jgi:hypothetical protein